MALAATEWADEPERWLTAELSSALVDWGRQSAAAECRGLGVLAEFDRRHGWAIDGQLSAKDWLVWRCGLSARTAHDKVRVAMSCAAAPWWRLPLPRAGCRNCQVRAITRITDADAETDEWLLTLARSGTVADLERVVRRWQSLADQERGLDGYLARFERRSVTATRTYDGMMVIQTVVPVEEGEEVLARLDDAPAGVAGEAVDERS